MAEANRSIPQIPIIRITTATHVLAQFRARQAVKDQLRKQGLKVSRYAARDITAMARVLTVTPTSRHRRKARGR